MAAREEIEKLKKSWLEDPCWDIECTEGFEEHEQELLAFRLEADAERTKKMEEKIEKRARVVLVETGISNQGAAQAIKTYDEIEYLASHPNYQSESIAETIAIAQVHATLLLAAQMQRIADALEERNKSDEADGNLEFMTKLYKVE